MEAAIRAMRDLETGPEDGAESVAEIVSRAWWQGLVNSEEMQCVAGWSGWGGCLGFVCDPWPRLCVIQPKPTKKA